MQFSELLLMSPDSHVENTVEARHKENPEDVRSCIIISPRPCIGQYRQTFTEVFLNLPDLLAYFTPYENYA